jgi:hypothetical protein
MSCPRPEKTSGAQVTTTITLPASALTVIAAPPALISQLNVESVCGIGPRVFLEAIRAPGFPLAVSPLGKLRLVVCADFVAWLIARGSAPPALPEHSTEDDGGLLAEFGLEEAPKRRASR